MSDDTPSGVKQWHISVATIITWTLLAGMAYASLRSQSDENERRINELEQRPSVTIQQFQDGQRNIEQRLQRIENKLDAVDERRH